LDPPTAGVRPDGKVERARAVSVWGQEALATFEQARPPRGRAKRSAGAGVRTRVFVKHPNASSARIVMNDAK
jgi:hypothetical protein